MRRSTIERHGRRRVTEVEGREVRAGESVWREGHGVEEVLGSNIEVAVVGGRVSAGDGVTKRSRMVCWRHVRVRV